MGSESHERCGTCRANRGALPAPGGVIYQDERWRLEHAIEPIPMAGWLVLKPRRHVEAAADLTDAEVGALGMLIKRATKAMSAELAPAKIYICLFAESADFPHIHFHLIPRFADTPPERRGPDVFAYLSDAVAQGRNLGDIEEAARIAEAIRTRMHVDGTDHP